MTPEDSSYDYTEPGNVFDPYPDPDKRDEEEDE
jgi:hypothetical protein